MSSETTTAAVGTTENEPTPKPEPQPEPKAPEDIHAVREEAANYRHRAHDAEARAEAAEKQLAAIRGVRLRQQVNAAHPAQGATDAIIEALGDTTEVFDESGGIDSEALDKRLKALASARPYLFDQHHSADVEAAWRDVREAHPRVPDEAREFCPSDDPDAIREWGERFAKMLAKIMGPNESTRLARRGAYTNASPSAPARGTDSLQAAIMGRRR